MLRFIRPIEKPLRTADCAHQARTQPVAASSEYTCPAFGSHRDGRRRRSGCRGPSHPEKPNAHLSCSRDTWRASGRPPWPFAIGYCAGRCPTRSRPGRQTHGPRDDSSSSSSASARRPPRARIELPPTDPLGDQAPVLLSQGRGRGVRIDPVVIASSTRSGVICLRTAVFGAWCPGSVAFVAGGAVGRLAPPRALGLGGGHRRPRDQRRDADSQANTKGPVRHSYSNVAQGHRMGIARLLPRPARAPRWPPETIAHNPGRSDGAHRR